MRDIATATLSGNLTRDVELHELPSGSDVARPRVATSTCRRSNGEERVEKTNYITVEVYGAQARACAQYLGKGSRVVVDVELDWREWTDQQGCQRGTVTFRARHVLFEGSRSNPTSSGNGRAPSTGSQRARPDAHAVPTAAIDEGTVAADDRPF